VRQRAVFATFGVGHDHVAHFVDGDACSESTPAQKEVETDKRSFPVVS
jgi:hypothetical protein